MRKIEIDDDIYEFLLKSTQEIGESASDILRRLLHIPKKTLITPLIQENKRKGDPRFTTILHWEKIGIRRNDETICESKAVDTMVLTLRRIVEELGEGVIENISKVKNRKLPLIMAKRPDTSYQTRPLGYKDYYVSVHSDNKGKKRLFERINRVLNSPEFVEAIDP